MLLEEARMCDIFYFAHNCKHSRANIFENILLWFNRATQRANIFFFQAMTNNETVV